MEERNAELLSALRLQCCDEHSRKIRYISSDTLLPYCKLCKSSTKDKADLEEAEPFLVELFTDAFTKEKEQTKVQKAFIKSEQNLLNYIQAKELTLPDGYTFDRHIPT